MEKAEFGVKKESFEIGTRHFGFEYE